MKNSQNTTVSDFTLSFGKFKGQSFSSTPSWYQEWLLQQGWFKKPTEKPLHQQLNGWDGYGRKGQAIYDAIFEQEKKMALREDCRQGICSCCVDSKYFGM
jgi:uncharacterized protein (DUF3820 family)